MKKNKVSKRTVVLATAALLSAVALLLVLVHLIDSKKMGAGSQDSSQTNQDSEGLIRYQGKWYEENDSIESILLIGVDQYETDGPENTETVNKQRSDFLILLLWNKEQNEVTALQLNRDTMAMVPEIGVMGDKVGEEIQQLALAHAYGSGGKDSCENTVQAVSNLLYGVKIDHYIAVTMDAVAVINDAVDGVTVHVEDDFSNVDDTLIQGEDVTLYGEHALRFVRGRYGMDDSTNMNRMARQRQYLQSLNKKASDLLKQDESFSMDLLWKINSYMTSDCTASYLSSLVNTLAEAENLPFETIKGESVKGKEHMEFYVDEEALQAQVIKLFYQEK